MSRKKYSNAKELDANEKFWKQITKTSDNEIMPICNPKSTYNYVLHFEKTSSFKWRPAFLFFKQIEIFYRYVLKEMYRNKSE